MLSIATVLAMSSAVFTATLAPVTAIGNEGWQLAGNGAATVTMSVDTVDFVAPAGTPVDAKIRKGVSFQVSALSDKPIIEGDNAHLVFEAYIGGKYTGIVYNTELPGTVHLTWGSSPDEYISDATFQARLASGAYKGFVYTAQTGHTNTADLNGETASVDYVEFNGTRYDFGKGIPALPITPADVVRPGVGNADGLGNGNGNGHAHGHENGNHLNGKGHAKR